VTHPQAPTLIIATILAEEGTSGVQTHFNQLRAHLNGRGGRVVLITPFNAPRFLVYPVFAVRKLLDPLSGAASVWWYRHWHGVFLKMALRKALARNPDSVVYAQCPLSARAALEVRRSSRQGVVMIVHFNGSQADEWCDLRGIARNGLLARRIRAMEARMLPSLDGIVHVSRYMKKELETRIPALRNIRNDVIPNFCRATMAPAAVQEPVDVISVGTLEPRKNQRFLLEVIAHAMRQGKRYTLALAGSGQDRAALEQLASDLGIAGQVAFLGHRPNAIEIMGSAKVYAHSALLENLPLALIEAMACGLPILAPAVGGIPDLFEAGEGGLFWDLRDVAGAGELLIRLLEDGTERKRMAAAAKRRFDERFAASQVADRLYAFILEPSARGGNAP
jgi:glycosyltransferase involved in cell wall biosynthesis